MWRRYSLLMHIKQPWKLWVVSSISFSTIMHADERNRAISEALEQDVYQWKNEFSGRGGARINPLLVRSRRPLCRSKEVKNGNSEFFGMSRGICF